MKFQEKFTKFDIQKVNYFDHKPIPILALATNNSNLLAILRNEGPIEIWKIKKQSFYLIKKVYNPPNFIADCICWCHERLFASGITGQILEYDIYNIEPKAIVSGNSGSIWSLKLDQSLKYLSAATEDGGVLIYDISLDNYPIKYIEKLLPISSNKQSFYKHDRINCVSWSYDNYDKNLLAFSTLYSPSISKIVDAEDIIPIEDNNKKFKKKKEQFIRNFGKIFIWDINFLYDSNYIDNYVDTTKNSKKQDFTKHYKVIDLEFLAREEHYHIHSKDNIINQTSLFINCMLFVDDNHTLVTGDSYGHIRFWNTQTCDLVKGIRIHEASVLTMCIEQKNSKCFYASGVDPLILQFEKAENGEWFKSNQRLLHSNDVKCLVHMSNWLISGGLDTKLVLSRFPPKTIIEVPHVPSVRDCKLTNCGKYLLLQFLNHLEIWELSLIKMVDSDDGIENFVKNAGSEDESELLNGKRKCDEELSSSFEQSIIKKSTKLLELRTNPALKIPLEIISSDISFNGEYLAYNDTVKTHVYQLFKNKAEQLEPHKIHFSVAPLQNSPKQPKGSKIKSNLLKFVMLPAPLVSPSSSRKDSKPSFAKKNDSNAGDRFNNALLLAMYDASIRIYDESENDKLSLTNYRIISIPHFAKRHDGTNASFGEENNENGNIGICALETRKNASEALIAVSYSSGSVVIHSLIDLKVIWRLDRNEMPCFTMCFHPTNSEIILIYPDNQICEYNYISDKPTVWSSIFNGLTLLDNEDVPIIKYSSKFAFPWAALKSLKSRKGKSKKIKQNGEEKTLMSQGEYKFSYSSLRGVFYNPQNTGQLILYDLDTIYTISKKGCCMSIPEQKLDVVEMENKYPSITEIKRYKYLTYMGIINEETLLVVETSPESIMASLLPALKKKKYGT
ncbi:unnamed protein product [Gordionus sp. m RMFG-2023]|uniref:U3 small nucleolar RNA-associated protein 4 homolog n=1 Tax=Gordionus sp. m RMFG-2023 TaxID=3053472 RepID=UPI0030E5DF4A